MPQVCRCFALMEQGLGVAVRLSTGGFHFGSTIQLDFLKSRYEKDHSPIGTFQPTSVSAHCNDARLFLDFPERAGRSPTPDGLYFGANTAEGGAGALFSLTTGTNNTAVGSEALFSLTTGKQNTAVGAQALKNDTADKNTAIGFQALVKNAAGDSNTAGGWRALFKNTTGDRNTASGRETLLSNTTGFENTGTGAVALQNNTTGNDNTATGFAALNNNTIGALNTAVGTGSLVNSSTGDLNIALGFGAGVDLTEGDNNGYIGNLGVGTESNIIRVGTEVAVMDQFGVLHPAHTATYIAGISDAEASDGDPVFITSTEKLGTVNVPSAARFKDEIKPMNETSETILALKPVAFRYKKELDPKGTPQFGLVAEEVEKVAPDLVKRDRDGKVANRAL